MEIIKLVVKDTIDDYMLELQQKKTQEIEGAIGVEALSNRYCHTLSTRISLFVCLFNSLHLTNKQLINY